MRKSAAVLGMALCAALLAGCVSRSDYDALSAECGEPRAQLETLGGELEAARADIAELQSYAKELNEENDEPRDALERAEKNAEALVKNFLRGGYDMWEYAIRVEHKS